MFEDNDQKRIAIYYEHPQWFKPLFAELERRGISYERLLASKFQYDPSVRSSPYSLVVNRMSPSAHTRGNAHAIFSTLHYLSYLKSIDANVLNGYDAYLHEISKARQVGLLNKLGIRHPRARVINSAPLAPAAAEGLVFPVILKPNIGGSGAMIVRFNSMGELSEAANNGNMNLGIDQTALIQEYLPAENGSIIRVEVLDGEFLYAIRLFLTEGEFNLCPADYCLPPVVEGRQKDGKTDSVTGLDVLVEAYTPPDDVIDDVLRITSAANIEVGGVEYLVNTRDGEVYYYDINALSNFVADAPNVIGFDPFPRLVDFIMKRAGIRSPEIA